MPEDHMYDATISDESTFMVFGFADEIDPDLETQLDVLGDLDIEYFDLRGVDETNVLDLSAAELTRIRDEINERGISISLIGLPIGKIGIMDDFEPHKERFEHAIEVAKFFNVEYIRVFSDYIPEKDAPAAHREEVIDRMR